MDEASDSETEASDSETEESDSGTELENFEKLKDKADESRIAEAAEENSTGTDPRDFSLKWMPYYRYTELENGLVQQDLTAFGTVPFSPTLGMFYEVPVAQYRDFSDVPGSLRTDGIGLGDIDLKFLWNPKAMRFSYGNGMSGSVLLGTDFILPTATNDALGGNALLAAPIVGLVLDMPLHGFFAALNLYFFDVYKEDAAPKTSRYVGRFFTCNR